MVIDVDNMVNMASVVRCRPWEVKAIKVPPYRKMDLSFILALLFTWQLAAAADYGYACRDVWFGKPSSRDALDALSQFPHQYGLRLFVQPQYLNPAFSPVKNPYGQSIVQIPKIWRAGKQSIL